jgi:hypothetical protein
MLTICVLNSLDRKVKRRLYVDRTLKIKYKAFHSGIEALYIKLFSVCYRLADQGIALS